MVWDMRILISLFVLQFFFSFLSFIMLWKSYSDRKTVGSDYDVFYFFTFSFTFSAAKRWLENS